MEDSDSGEVRLDKLYRIIAECPHAIHDISRITLDQKNNLPRFNMPFELGLDMACKKYGSKKINKKQILILEAKKFRYQKYLSDIAGVDTTEHGNSLTKMIKVVRYWLRTISKDSRMLGDKSIAKAYKKFVTAFPGMCKSLGINAKNVNYDDYVGAVYAYLDQAKKP